MVPVLRALLRSHVALAPEILYLAPLSIVTKQEPQNHTLIPASVETYGYLMKPLVRYLNTLSEVATASGD